MKTSLPAWNRLFQKWLYAERRLALGIEIVLSNPTSYFAYRLNVIWGMASFDIAKNTLNTIRLDCPIWLIGIEVQTPK